MRSLGDVVDDHVMQAMEGSFGLALQKEMRTAVQEGRTAAILRAVAVLVEGQGGNEAARRLSLKHRDPRRLPG